MTDPYNGPETMLFDEPSEKRSAVQQQPEAPTISKESKDVIELFKVVVEEPNNQDKLWDFTKKYLTYLEDKSGEIKSIIDPESKESLMITLKNKGISEIPWSIYNMFLTISNIGSTIAQNETLDGKSNFYIKYVMLSFDSESPIYQFTQLLQTLQTQDDKTREIYQKLDSLFMDAFKKYEHKEPVKTKTNTSPSFLENKVSICGKEISMKLLIIILIVILLILGIGGSAYWYSKTKTILPLSVETLPSSNASDISSVYSN